LARSIRHLAHQSERAFVEIGIMSGFGTVATLSGIHEQEPASPHSSCSALLGVARDFP
jgi:hypothetical protein